MEMRRAVAVFGYNRPDYLRECAIALDKALAAAAADYDVYLMLDGGPEAKQSECIEVFRAEYHHPWRVDCAAENESNSRIVRKLDWLFHKCGYDLVVLVEDDAVLAPNAFQFVERSFDWLKREGWAYFHHNSEGIVGLVSLWFACHLRPEDKQRYAGDLFVSTSNLFAYYVWRDTWDVIWPHLEVYARTYPKPFGIHARVYRQWLNDWRKPLRCRLIPVDGIGGRITDAMYVHPVATSQDAIIATALVHEGLLYLSPVVNRCINIGKIGLHSPTEDIWKSFQWDDITCDSVEEPDSYAFRRFPPEAATPRSS
jgi:hypothetical protein